MKHVKFSPVFLLLLVFVLTSCGTRVTEQPSTKLLDMDAYIDSAIQGEERAVMREVLSNLAPEDRENVTYVDGSGHTYVNRLELKTASTIYKESGEDKNILVSAEGERITAPPSLERPDVGEISAETYTPSCSRVGTGAYWRSFTVGLKNYVYQEATIFFPKSVGDFTKIGIGNTGDVPYVYLGGWGPGGVGVDAGFQFNYDTRTWSLFTTYSGTQISDTSSAVRFRDNQAITTKFYISAANQVTVVATGLRYDGVSQTRTLVRNVSGWPVDGYDVVMKAIDSIAQPAAQVGSDADGILIRGSFTTGIRVYNRKASSVKAPSSTQKVNMTYASGSPCRWTTTYVTYTGTNNDATISINLR